MVRTVYVPRFGSQLGSSQRGEPERRMPSSQRKQRGNKPDKVREEETRFVLKVKLPKVRNSTLNKKGTKKDKTQRGWMLETTTIKNKTTESRGGDGTDSEDVVGDIFTFSQRPTSTAMSEKAKAKLAVLRTISKMLEENQLIRQRLAAVSQAN